MKRIKLKETWEKCCCVRVRVRVREQRREEGKAESAYYYYLLVFIIIIIIFFLLNSNAKGLGLLEHTSRLKFTLFDSLQIFFLRKSNKQNKTNKINIKGRASLFSSSTFFSRRDKIL